MPITFEEMLARVSRDEPDYEEASQLGADALPYLRQFVEAGDPALASKATYMAAAINAEQSAAVVEIAAQSVYPIVRVAAAGSLGRLSTIPVPLAIRLLEDEDTGVRKWTLLSLEIRRPVGIKAKVQAIARDDVDMTLRLLASQLANQLPQGDTTRET